MTDVEVVEDTVAADIFIQWKGTDLCGDFTCECGWGGHIDKDFVYAVKCGGCGQVWIMPWNVSLVKMPADETDTHRLFWAQEDRVIKPISDEELSNS